MKRPGVDLDLEREALAFALATPNALVRLPAPEDMSSAAHALIATLIAERKDVRIELVRRGDAFVQALDAIEALEHVSFEQESRLDHLRALAAQRAMRERLVRAVSHVDRGDTESALEELRAIDSTPRDQTIVPAHVAARLALDDMTKDRPLGVARTGFPVLDGSIGELRPATMTIVGGRTGAGKSSLVLSAALNAAKNGARVGIVSCEDPVTVYGERVLAALADVRESDVRSGGAASIARAEDGIALARERGVSFAFRLNRPVSDVLAAIRTMTATGCTVIAVDYLQAIALHDTKAESHRLVVSSAAQAIKAECQAANVALIVASQLRRPSENPFREPHSFDLKESGDLENMAEAIVLLWQESDDTDARVLGKVSKVKWSASRPRFEVQRNPAGAIVSLPLVVPELRQPRSGGRSFA